MQEQTGNVIIGKAGPGDSFTIKYGWFKFKLEIKPLTAKQIIEFSGEISKLREVNTENDMFAELLEGSNDLRHISKAIAIATGTRLRKLIARAILKLPIKDIATLMAIVKKQSDPELFFYTIALARGLNKLKPKAQQ